MALALKDVNKFFIGKSFLRRMEEFISWQLAKNQRRDLENP
jgi:hypothetical protein